MAELFVNTDFPPCILDVKIQQINKLNVNFLHVLIFTHTKPSPDFCGSAALDGLGPNAFILKKGFSNLRGPSLKHAGAWRQSDIICYY